MRGEFQSIQELMEYVEREAWRRAKAILEKYEVKVQAPKLDRGAGLDPIEEASRAARRGVSMEAMGLEASIEAARRAGLKGFVNVEIPPSEPWRPV